LASILASWDSIICYISIVWRVNNQDPMHCPTVPHLTPVVTCISDYRWGSDW
jgi:hypothetical protein